jgi:hypothetical protein
MVGALWSDSVEERDDVPAAAVAVPIMESISADLDPVSDGEVTIVVGCSVDEGEAP